MTKHTPGPWKANKTYIGTDEDNSQTIAYCDDHRNRRPRPIGEHHANARLIAAAPDLLDACQDAIESLGSITCDNSLSEGIVNVLVNRFKVVIAVVKGVEE